MNDPINNPEHYTSGDIECIDAIRAALTPEEFRGFCKGNVIKYTWRERLKGQDESLKKAIWYADRAVSDAQEPQTAYSKDLNDHQNYLMNILKELIYQAQTSKDVRGCLLSVDPEIYSCETIDGRVLNSRTGVKHVNLSFTLIQERSETFCGADGAEVSDDLPMPATDDSCAFVDYTDGEWHDWHGGECPVSGDVMVQYVTRRGYQDSRRAKHLEWTHIGHPGDIIRFRAIK